MPRTSAHRIRPRFPTMVGRAMLRRCPWCAQPRAWFTGWFARRERCPRCGLRWARNPGFMTGSMTVNIIITFGLMTAVMVATFIATLPDLPVGPLIAVLIAIAIVVPIATYPLTCTLWAAVELAMKPPDAAELADALLATDPSSAG
jgi:uncharacterized protein (DUF983 family)